MFNLFARLLYLGDRFNLFGRGGGFSGHVQLHRSVTQQLVDLYIRNASNVVLTEEVVEALIEVLVFLSSEGGRKGGGEGGRGGGGRSRH